MESKDIEKIMEKAIQTLKKKGLDCAYNEMIAGHIKNAISEAIIDFYEYKTEDIEDD